MLNVSSKVIKALQGKNPVLGVSGGIDSMVLLHLLLKHEVKPIVAHINYKKRGIESDLDEELVRSFCQQHDLIFFCKRVNVHSTGNFQEEAREVRYAFFREIRQKFDSGYILTAHHKDDYVETVFMRLRKKKSLSSLHPIKEIDGCLVRPLIYISKKDIEAYQKSENIAFRLDKTNLESDYTRNYIRNCVIPAMEKEGLNWQKMASYLGKISERYSAFISCQVNTITIGNRLNIQEFLSSNEYNRKSILHFWISRETGFQVSSGFLESLSEVENIQIGRSVSINENFKLLRDRDFLLIIKTESDTNTSLKIDQSSIPFKKAILGNHIVLERSRWSGLPKEGMLELCSLKLKWPLTIRNWIPGDKIKLFGMQGSQLISDVLTNQKVPTHQKSASLVVETFDSKICAVIFTTLENKLSGRISGSFACTTQDDETLTIKFIKN